MQLDCSQHQNDMTDIVKGHEVWFWAESFLGFVFHQVVCLWRHQLGEVGK